jgi:hypothetical protein
VGEDALQAELRRRPRSRSAPREGDEEGATPIAVQHDPAEEFCLALLLRHPPLRGEGNALSDDFFELGEHRAIFAAWQSQTDLESLRATLPEELHPQLDRILSRNVPFLEGTRLREAFLDCVRRIELRRLTAAKRASTASLSDPEDGEEMRAVIEEARALAEARDQTGAAAAAVPAPAPDAGVSQRWELATALVEDTELGRRLHQTASGHIPGGHSPAAPPGEDGS